jgi:RNA polymerase sigma factor (sigma-70 family)
MSAGGGAFPSTRHSVVRAIADADPDVRREAYGALVRSYWKPVYVYIRLRWHRDPVEAQDLTQEFFVRCFEKEYLERFDPSKARFRTFVRTCLDAFLANERQAAARLKRGGRTIIEPLDFTSADAELAVRVRGVQADPEAWFQREWIRALFASAVEELEARAAADARQLAFQLFTRYELDEEDTAQRRTYAALARELDTSVSNVTNQLAWARRAFRTIVLAKLRSLCATDEEFRAEARDLLRVRP